MTFEGLGSRVLPEVTGQLVGPGEFPAAALPGALVRLLARVGPHVGLQVGALGVNLVTARVRTPVHLLAPAPLPLAPRQLDTIAMLTQDTCLRHVRPGDTLEKS